MMSGLKKEEKTAAKTDMYINNKDDICVSVFVPSHFFPDDTLFLSRILSRQAVIAVVKMIVVMVLVLLLLLLLKLKLKFSETSHDDGYV